MESGDDYKKLPNVVTINILDFEFIESDKYHTTFHLWEDTEKIMLTTALESHFIEMPKFLKLESKDIINNPLHRWLAFFDENINEELLKELIEMDKTIKKANERLNFLAQDKDFLHQVHLREIALSDYTTVINDAKDEGILKGKLEVAENLLKEGMSLESISKVTGIAIDTIKERQKIIH